MKHLKDWLGVLVIALAFAPWMTRADAVVINSNDSGAGSLRAVIAVALPNSTITFTNTLAGETIKLTSGEILIKTNLAIDGSSAGGICISGNNLSRVFKFVPGISCVLNRLILTNALAAGIFPTNTGGAVFLGAGANLVVSNSVLCGNVADYGGGVLVDTNAALTLYNFTLSGNVATFSGGGIYNNGGTLTLNECTVSSNRAAYGGGVYSVTDLSSQKTVAINSTFFGNASGFKGGAIFNNIGHTELTHCTIVGNSVLSGEGGGVGSYGDSLTETVVQDTIIAGNSTDADLSGAINHNSFTSLGHNLIGNGTALSAFNQTGDLTNSIPQLAAPGYYGGTTQTMPPLHGSLAIDAGGTTALNTDQRGWPRPIGAAADIGAVEFQALPVIVPPVLKNPAWISGNQKFQFTFTNVVNADFSVLITTNIAGNNWTVSGLALQTSPGQYAFAEAQTNRDQRFYRVSSP